MERKRLRTPVTCHEHDVLHSHEHNVLDSHEHNVLDREKQIYKVTRSCWR